MDIDTTQIKKLRTSHDTGDLHKLLGIFVLGHWIYRIAIYFLTGSTGLFDTLLTFLCFMMHALLSLSSLIFDIPKRRNQKYTVIYSELRAHSIIFTLRSVWFGIYTFIGMPENPLVRVATMLLFHVGADIATAKLGSPENGTTIRGNEEVNDKRIGADHPLYKKFVGLGTLFACSCQIFASYSIALYSFLPHNSVDHQNMALLTLMPIQLAAFVSTLVRKGIIGNTIAQLIYLVTLGLNYLFWSHCWQDLLIQLCLVVCRFYFRINKYVMWLGVGLFFYLTH